MTEEWIAHSAGVTGKPQSMHEHLMEVRNRAQARCPAFLQTDVRLASIFHDFGKYSELFRLRLKGQESGLDHWCSGAHLLLKHDLSDLAAAAVHAHHVGLGAWARVSALKCALASVEGRKPTLQTQPDMDNAYRALIADGFKVDERGRKLKPTIASMLDTRMVLSALVDGDYADTARHMRGEHRPGAPSFDSDRALVTLDQYVASLGVDASDEVREVRATLRMAAQDAASNGPGLFTLEAPTGSGKTLAMLEFALRQMAAPGSQLRRLIVVLPFLSILDQTVREYQRALGEQKTAILEHHSLAEWRRPLRRDEDENGVGAEEARRRAAEAFSEDWEPPVIITTTVQFFESLFSAHPGTCRKLCSIANSVVLVDEVQTLPRPLLLATVRALSRLAHPDYGCTVILSTATQPLLSHFEETVSQEIENAGWKPISIVSRSDGLYEKTRRYEIDWSRCSEPVSWESIADELAPLSRALCIVNTRKDASRLTELVLKRSPNSPVLHLSTNMCAAHRRTVIGSPAVVNLDHPCILISTQCVEAGVDLDFPVVYRALAPLDAVAQAAGRCNRAGSGTGEVRVFLPEEAVYPGKLYQQGAEQTGSLLRQGGHLDPQDPALFDRYFELLYGLETLPGTTAKLEQAIRELDFPTVARIYQLIDHRDVVHVLVPYGDAPEVPGHVSGAFFRAAQPYVVDANRQDAAKSLWLGTPILGTDDWYALVMPGDCVPEEDRPYSLTFGLRLEMELPVI